MPLTLTFFAVCSLIAYPLTSNTLGQRSHPTSSTPTGNGTVETIHQRAVSGRVKIGKSPGQQSKIASDSHTAPGCTQQGMETLRPLDNY